MHTTAAAGAHAASCQPSPFRRSAQSSGPSVSTPAAYVVGWPLAHSATPPPAPASATAAPSESHAHPAPASVALGCCVAPIQKSVHGAAAASSSPRTAWIAAASADVRGSMSVALSPAHSATASALDHAAVGCSRRHCVRPPSVVARQPSSHAATGRLKTMSSLAMSPLQQVSASYKVCNDAQLPSVWPESQCAP